MWLSEKCNCRKVWIIQSHFYERKTEHNLCESGYVCLNIITQTKRKFWKDTFWVNSRSYSGDDGGKVEKGRRGRKEKIWETSNQNDRVLFIHSCKFFFSHFPHFIPAMGPLCSFSNIPNILLPRSLCNCHSCCLELTSSEILCMSYPHFQSLLQCCLMEAFLGYST